MPETPLRSALSTSSATRAAPACSRSGVGEAVDVEAELLGVADQVVRAKRVLVLEQEVVHLPERALVGGRLGGLGGELGVRVDVVERQVPPDVADVAEVAQELADDRLRLAAVGALEVAVLDDRDRRVERPADVVALRIDVDVEVDERLGGAEQGADPQAPRQQRRGAEEQPGEERRAEGGAEDAELRLLELRAVEGERRDEQRDGEADPGDRAAAGDRRPADRRPQPPAAQPRERATSCRGCPPACRRRSRTGSRA